MGKKLSNAVKCQMKKQRGKKPSEPPQASMRLGAVAAKPPVFKGVQKGD